MEVDRDLTILLRMNGIEDIARAHSLSQTGLKRINASQFTVDESIRDFVKIRQNQSHKGTYGHALLLAGSYGKMGATVLSAKGCLRSGVGLLTVHVPKCGYQIMQIAVPEAMCSTDSDEIRLTNAPDFAPYAAIGVGPGIGKDTATASLLKSILVNCSSPLVLDADALNILSEDKELLQQLPENTILTPHVKEFDRLAGESLNREERLKKQRTFAQQYNCIVVLKDAETCIASPAGEQFFNTSGNPGMATGGSGDVLTGIITGLLAQGYHPLVAALIAVYFHGLAGDAAAKYKGENALIASDLCDFLKIEHHASVIEQPRSVREDNKDLK